jgi:hypothetical protein
MSILESDWRIRRDGLSAVGSDGASTDQPDLPEAVGAGTSDRIRKTIGRWR